MQTLGLSDSTPRTESRWRSLLWPSIKNEWDYDYVTTQGFWVCLFIAVVTVGVGLFQGAVWASLFEGVIYFLAAIGVRQRSRAAAIFAFSSYLLGAMVIQRFTGQGFGIQRMIFLALLFSNVRGSWLSAQWAKESGPDREMPTRLNQTWGDRLSDQMPVYLWPKVRIAFYLLATIQILFLLIALVVPVPRGGG